MQPFNSSNSPWSSELEAMRAVAEALDALDGDAARRRVLSWAADRFALHVSPASPAQTHAGVRNDSAPGAGGSGSPDESPLEVPGEAELYAGAPARPDDRHSLEELIVHCAALDPDALAVEAGFVERVAEPDLVVEIPGPAAVASASRLDLQSLLRGLVDEFDALVKAWQGETACAA